MHAFSLKLVTWPFDCIQLIFALCAANVSRNNSPLRAFFRTIFLKACKRSELTIYSGFCFNLISFLSVSCCCCSWYFFRMIGSFTSLVTGQVEGIFRGLVVTLTNLGAMEKLHEKTVAENREKLQRSIRSRGYKLALC